MIRRATRDDIPACARIIADWESETDYLPASPGADKIAEMIDKAFDLREIWVSGDPVEGYMSVDPDASQVGGLYLIRRCEGLGKRLLDVAKRGRAFLWLTVFAQNTRAFAFYRREGFRLMSTLPTGDGGCAVLRMEWRA
jgi:N-acetylglutamate synthase-like GNAT family acetyltransferase